MRSQTLNWHLANADVAPRIWNHSSSRRIHSVPSIGLAKKAPVSSIDWHYDEYNPKAEDEHFAHNCPDAPEELREHAKKRLLLGDY